MRHLRFRLHKLEAPRYGPDSRLQSSRNLASSTRGDRSIFAGNFGCFGGVSYLILHVGGDFPSPQQKDTMRLTPWYLAAIAPVAVAGCSGAFFGHFAVLALTLGIFFGTLSLGRQAVARHDTPAPVAGSEKVDV